MKKTVDKRVSINYKNLPTGFMAQFALYQKSQSMVFKSLFLVVLMITMSLSAGVVQTSPATQPSEEESSGLSFMISYDSFEWDFTMMNPINWFDEEETATELASVSYTHLTLPTICSV